jgi:predicted protein tyrosine phosphatase|uniref:hypothetical protein n=1 Tax=Orrella sp. TaxID=1921583 RepID=UPI00404837D0
MINQTFTDSQQLASAVEVNLRRQASSKIDIVMVMIRLHPFAGDNLRLFEFDFWH